MMPGHPDWAALYQRHRDAMYRVAAKVLREAGLADQAGGDAVQAAMVSLMKSPPSGCDQLGSGVDQDHPTARTRHP